MKYYESVLELIGNTPLLRLKKIESKLNLNYKLFAKVERNNPTGSIKDRAAYFMIKDALNKKIINKDTLIIEPTSGNTGIGLASICAYYGLKLHIYMPSSNSIERRKMMSFLGAKVILTDKSKGMKGALEEAIKEHNSIKNSFIPSQFENENNFKAHYETTAEEIILALDKKIDVFISGIGTSGTIMGVSKRLKEENIPCKIIGVEPKESPLISQNIASSHKIEGIGANFLPPILDRNFIDEMHTVSYEEAKSFMELLAKEEGLLVGISSGAILKCACSLAETYKNKNVVIVLPDNFERYLSVYDY